MGGEAWSASKMDLAKHIFFSVLRPSIRKGVEWLLMVEFWAAEDLKRGIVGDCLVPIPRGGLVKDLKGEWLRQLGFSSVSFHLSFGRLQRAQPHRHEACPESAGII